MKKSLTPLILFFALVILCTIIIINSLSPKPEADHEKEPLIPSMQLRNERGKRFQPGRADLNSYSGHEPLQKDYRAAVRQARQLLVTGKLAEAEDVLRTYLVFDPTCPEVLFLLGGLLCHTQRYPEAETIFYRQLRVDPTQPGIYAKLFYPLYAQDKLEQVEEIIQAGLKIDPDSAEFLINMAAMYAKLDQPGPAMEFFRKAHQRLGPEIVIFTYDPDFDSLRKNPEFIGIIKTASARTPRLNPSPGQEKPATPAAEQP